MRRRRRTEILINGSQKLVEDTAHCIKDNYQVKVIQEPESGLVMMKVRETSQKSLFYPGEVLVTECKVQIVGKIGIGIVTGDQPELSYNLAVIDAAYEAMLPETIGWKMLLENEEKVIQEQRAAANQSILKTKVNFETMDV
ncbi:alpha-D-ribose 1-methylphosphonate 5-triphosphate synthase subunit PhnG [Bacillus niacini]|uniref:Alpha-D-ribose 1-methylphosphonate 5-triphosphate synthase subunit PhnG n=1 Tax=Neobacillus niacini TaxID=86668 RepID=A0A852TN17_9BACI|nr:phosphonate C-P lyase system protein PhnG [Neobacillus niacini]NYE08528.1 alpha-D-ribose 1-methylphosphonate 5-triphosphate synthase subunit PhnG [Neobacillus niacini]